MSEFFLKIVNMSISAGWLVLTVLLLRLILKKAPKWVNVILWGFVAIRLICPFSIESMLSLIPSAETISPQIMTDTAPEFHTGINSLNSIINPIVSESFAPDPGVSMNPLQLWIPLASIAWIAGITAMLIYTTVSYILLRRKIATAVMLRDNIYQSENVVSPFVLGIIKPKIYLPFRIEGQNMEHIIAHEESHIYRKDHWWKPLGFILLALHWFNPLMWVGYILLCKDIELACDEKAIKEMDNQNRADYTEALVACSVSRRSIAACPLAFGEVGVKERVRSVMNYKKPAFWIILAAILACTVVAVCFLTNPRTSSPGILPNIHSHTYVVQEVTYESGMFSFTVKAGENSPIYAVTEEMNLVSQGEYGEESDWTQLGELEEIELTKANFDDLFTPEIWLGKENAKTIRQNNVKAWRLIYNQEYRYYLLQQENGDIYLAYGYEGTLNNIFRWLFKLSIDTTGASGIVAKSGDGAAPMVSFPKGTMVKDYIDSVYWLTIDPSDEEFVPFSVWRDGKEIRGTYTAYDTETFEPIEHFIPSGLDPQTYLFQNADPTKNYIVLATFSTEPNAEIYAFGARFDSTISSVGGADGPSKTYSEVKLINTESDYKESSYTVGAKLPATDLSQPGQVLADKIAEEWNTYDSITQQERILSSHLWGAVYIDTDTWDECIQAIGTEIDNPLESIEWIKKTGYFGSESENPSLPVTHVKATTYSPERKLSEIRVDAGYNCGEIQITLQTTVSATAGAQMARVISSNYATFEQNEATTGSGIPVLIMTTNTRNNTGYYSGEYFNPTAYWVRDNVFYTLRVSGYAADKIEIQETLERLLAEI